LSDFHVFSIAKVIDAKHQQQHLETLRMTSVILPVSTLLTSFVVFDLLNGDSRQFLFSAMLNPSKASNRWLIRL